MRLRGNTQKVRNVRMRDTSEFAACLEEKLQHLQTTSRTDVGNLLNYKSVFAYSQTQSLE